MKQISIFLIHGVGRRPSGVIKKRVSRLLLENDRTLNPENIHEIEWEEEELNFINYANQLKYSDLMMLSTVWNNAAHLGFESANYSNYYQKIVNFISSFFAICFQLLTYLLPIFFVGLFGCNSHLM